MAYEHGKAYTDIEHHEDGSHTVTVVHRNGKLSKHAVADLDGVHDKLEEHLREPEEIEACLKARGVDPEKVEEFIHPDLHAEALDLAGKKYGFDPEVMEEKVDPNIHKDLSRLLSGD